MTIEVRQLLVKASVTEDAPAGQPEQAAGHDWQQLKEEILAECQEWLARKLQDARER